MSEGIEKVKARLRCHWAARGCRACLRSHRGNAVAAWVSRVDDTVVRNTRDVDLLVRREDMEAIVEVMARGGFIHRSVSILGGKGRIEMFLDGRGQRCAMTST